MTANRPEPGWAALDRELSIWSDGGAPAALWLRDDDAIDATPELDRLLALTAEAGLPLTLAVIPAGAKTTLARRLARAHSVSVLQHGYAHANHAPTGAKKSEYADGRTLEAMKGELVRGRATLARMFGSGALAALAPPWNRMTPALTPHLAACGLGGLSRFKPREAPLAAPGVVEVNAHVDLIEWRAGRVGKPADAVAGEIARHLRERREGLADAGEPTGILAHHLTMDPVAWTSLADMIGRLATDPRVRWLAGPELFPLAADGTVA